MPCAAGQEDRRYLTAIGITHEPTAWVQRDLVGKTVHVLPVDGQQQVEAVIQRFQRSGTQAQQRRGLAAADLRAAGAHHQAIQTRTGCRVKQQCACRHDTAAAAAGDGDRQAGFVARRGDRICRLRIRLGLQKGIHSSLLRSDAVE